ncbi:MAG: hypothetical protein IID07_08445 [Gemmatimonadetes bacterium]|nr:hypothetical protein [Gemmatimonadota bacterium]
MNSYRLAAGALAVVLMGLTQAPLDAQLPPDLREYPLTQRHKSGDLVAPFFDGWYDNGDGSVTFVFGFMNRNTEEIVDIPLGPDNYLQPARFDGVQPTHFPVYNRRGLTGIRERGAFAVTVPADMAGTEVVWTLSHAGHSYSVPGRATSTAYELSRTAAARGSLSPVIRFNRNGPESVDREGIVANRVTARVGIPVTLSALVQDRGERRGYDVDSLLFPVGTTWILHQGPALIQFEPESVSGRERRAAGEGVRSNSDGWSVATTQATFSEPGDYIVRLRVDNFMAPDSKFDNQCCWSNAYVPVRVTR